MITPRRDVRQLTGGLVALFFALAILALANAQGINDPQFKKSVPCAKLQNGNYVWGCSRFYSVCVHHKEHIMHCYSNLVLNPDNNQCDDPANVWSCQKPTPGALYKAKDPFTCNTSPDGNYVAEHCSDYYYVCIGGNRLTQQCPTGTVFNGEQRVCDHIADCKSTEVPHVKPVQLDEQSQADALPPPAPTTSPQNLYPAKVIAAPESRRRSANIIPLRRMFPLRRNAGSHYPIVSPPGAGAPAALPPVADTFIVNGGNDGYNNNVNFDDSPPAALAPNAFSEFDCAGKTDGVYVTGANSCGQSFWKCANGYAFEYACPAGLYYDASSVQCTQREFIAACGGTPQVTTTTTTATTVASQQDAGIPAFDCDGKNGIHEQAPCSPTFISCNGGHVWTMTCPKGLVYQKSTANCVTQVECNQSGTPPAIAQDDVQVQSHAASQAPSGYEQQPKSIQPPQQSPQQPPQQLQQPSVDPYAQSVPQSDFITQPPTTPTTTEIPTTTKAPFDCSGKPDGYYYKRKCKQSFIICSKGQLSQQKCPDGLLFDPFLANCQYADICGKSTTTPPPTTTTTTAAPKTVATTSKPDFDCSGRDNGYYAKQPCTSTFYSCAHGYTIQLTCPLLLVFDVDAKVCEYPNVCGTVATTTATVPQADVDVAPSNPYQVKAPAPPPQAAPTVTPKPPPFDCSNKPDNNYAIQPCHNAYAICISGKPITAKCQAGLVYDAANGFCNYPNNCDVNAKPTTTTLAPPPVIPKTPKVPAVIQDAVVGPKSNNLPTQSKKNFFCKGKPDGTYSKSDCSAKFIKCWHNETTRLSCPKGFVYDAKNNACEYKAICGKSKVEPIDEDAPISTASASTTVAPVIAFDCTTNGQFALGNCQNAYVVCLNGFPNSYKCPGSLVYDSITQKCEYAEDCGKTTPQPPIQEQDNLEPNEEENFTIVKADAASSQQSPHSYTTSTWASPAADAPSNGNCGEIPKGTHAFATCSSKYISCYNGQINIRSCASGLIYRQSAGACVSASKVPACKIAADVTVAPLDSSTVASSTDASSSPPTSNPYGEVPQINQQTLKRRSSYF